MPVGIAFGWKSPGGTPPTSGAPRVQTLMAPSGNRSPVCLQLKRPGLDLANLAPQRRGEPRDPGGTRLSRKEAETSIQGA